MNMENKKLVRLIAEQQVRILELEQQLDLADNAIRVLSAGGKLPFAKR